MWASLVWEPLLEYHDVNVLHRSAILFLVQIKCAYALQAPVTGVCCSMTGMMMLNKASEAGGVVLPSPLWAFISHTKAFYIHSLPL